MNPAGAKCSIMVGPSGPGVVRRTVSRPPITSSPTQSLIAARPRKLRPVSSTVACGAKTVTRAFTSRESTASM